MFQKKYEKKLKKFLKIFFEDFWKNYFVKFYMVFTRFKGGYFGKKLGPEKWQKIANKAFSCIIASLKNRRKVAGPATRLP